MAVSIHLYEASQTAEQCSTVDSDQVYRLDKYHVRPFIARQLGGWEGSVHSLAVRSEVDKDERATRKDDRDYSYHSIQ